MIDTTQSKTDRVELTREKISTSFGKLYVDQRTRKFEAGNRWAAYYLWKEYYEGTHGVDKDPARANKWLGEFLKDVYVLRFEPANGFSPQNAHGVCERCSGPLSGVAFGQGADWRRGILEDEREGGRRIGRFPTVQ